jgi:hypothetical protein
MVLATSRGLAAFPAGRRATWRARDAFRLGVALLAGIIVLPLTAAQGLAQPQPVQPGGGFAFPYPNFTGAPGAMTAQQYAQTFNAAYHIPATYSAWATTGRDIRVLNPSGVYLKHLNLRTILSGPGGPAEGHPDYNFIKTYHPEWILKDRWGNPASLFGWGEMLDFGNDAFLDWALNVWMPAQYFDPTDADPNRVTWYMHDNGNFHPLGIDCAPADFVCTRYNTEEGVLTAWENLLRRFKARYPNKKMVISTGPVTFQPVDQQMAVFRRVLSLADGYFSESLTTDFTYFADQPNNGKRTVLMTTMQLASWLGDTGKVFFPNFGMSAGVVPTQAQVNYAWAFFNVMRKGNWQFFSKLTKDGSGNWVPMKYPEMDRALGQPTEIATQIASNVWRRDFTGAIAYVNLSDGPTSIPLPAGSYTNSLGQVVGSPVSLSPFSGLTVYKTGGVSGGRPAAPHSLTVQ